jgi:hypothetical protein
MKKKKRFQPGDIVYIKWADHFSDSSWRDIKHTLEDHAEVIESYGRFVGENKEASGLVIATNFVVGRERVGITMTILKATILDMKKLA